MPAAAAGHPPHVVEGSGEPGLLSVVIPTFQRRDRLAEAIASVLSQTHHRLEVIVVDDGSTDGTGAMVRALEDPRIRYVRQENRGVAAARNRGLRECRGEFVALLDSDDTWLPWKAEAQLAILRSLPAVGMVWTDMRAVDGSDALVAERFLRVMYSAHRRVRIEEALERADALRSLVSPPAAGPDGAVYHGDLFPSMIHGNLVHTSTVVLRRSRLESAGGFDEGYRVAGEDYEFHFRTCAHGPVAFLDEPSIAYRVGEADAITVSAGPEIARASLATLERYLGEHAPRFRLSRAERRGLLAWTHGWVGEVELEEGNRARAASHLASSLLRRPWQPRRALLLAASALPGPIARSLRAAKRRLSGRTGSGHTVGEAT